MYDVSVSVTVSYLDTTARKVSALYLDTKSGEVCVSYLDTFKKYLWTPLNIARKKLLIKDLFSLTYLGSLSLVRTGFRTSRDKDQVRQLHFVISQKQQGSCVRPGPCSHRWWNGKHSSNRKSPRFGSLSGRRWPRNSRPKKGTCEWICLCPSSALRGVRIWLAALQNQEKPNHELNW